MMLKVWDATPPAIPMKRNAKCSAARRGDAADVELGGLRPAEVREQAAGGVLGLGVVAGEEDRARLGEFARGGHGGGVHRAERLDDGSQRERLLDQFAQAAVGVGERAEVVGEADADVDK